MGDSKRDHVTDARTVSHASVTHFVLCASTGGPCCMHTALWKGSSHVMELLCIPGKGSTLLPRARPFSGLASLFTHTRQQCLVPSVCTSLNRCSHRRCFGWKPRKSSADSEHRDMSRGEEDAAKAAILNKVIQGRPTDLLLRCKQLHCSTIFCLLRWPHARHRSRCRG